MGADHSMTNTGRYRVESLGFASWEQTAPSESWWSEESRAAVKTGTELFG
jgi:hypothetical protein